FPLSGGIFASATCSRGLVVARIHAGRDASPGVPDAATSAWSSFPLGRAPNAPWVVLPFFPPSRFRPPHTGWPAETFPQRRRGVAPPRTSKTLRAAALS
ncbi:unnamed protein product, partial [Musa textilis]